MIGAYQFQGYRRDGLPARKITALVTGSMKKRDSISEHRQTAGGRRAGWSGTHNDRIQPGRLAHSAFAKKSGLAFNSPVYVDRQ
jgi:hypothetical protein